MYKDNIDDYTLQVSANEEEGKWDIINSEDIRGVVTRILKHRNNVPELPEIEEPPAVEEKLVLLKKKLLKKHIGNTTTFQVIVQN